MKDKQLLKSGFALLDGHVEKVGNFRMEPPSLFRGRGKHPRTGVVKQRTEPDRVAINVGRDRAPPRCHEPGRSWSDVQHDDSVTWLATWHENVMSPRLSFPTLKVMPHRRDGVDAVARESTRLAR